MPREASKEQAKTARAKDPARRAAGRIRSTGM
jgi:hypothetical protein